MLKAVPAVHWPSLAWLERHLSWSAAVVADDVKHLARPALPGIRAVFGVIPLTAPGGPATRAAHRIDEAPLGEEALLPSRKYELCAAVATHDYLIFTDHGVLNPLVLVQFLAPND